MPRAEQTPTPAFKRGAELPQGAAQQVQALASSIPESIAQAPDPLDPDEPGYFDDDDIDDDDEPGFSPSGDAEQFLFAPTDRPTESLFSGVPVGPGTSVSRFAYETDGEFAARVASDLMQDSDPKVRAFAERLRFED